jgi:hypothetical protein
MSYGILRTRNSAIIQLAKVNEGTSKAKREELAKVNGYYINPALVGIAYDRLCFATLHVIFGATMTPRDCMSICIVPFD